MLKAATYIGLTIVRMINVFKPDAVFLGGGVIESGSFFLKKIRETAYQEMMHPSSRKPEIIKASFGKKAAVTGSVSLILNEILNPNIIFY